MGLPELKNKIHLQVENADERVLRIVASVFDNYMAEIAADGNENSLPFSDLEKKAIDEAIYQIDNGQTIAHDVVMEETKAKYSKYFRNED